MNKMSEEKGKQIKTVSIASLQWDEEVYPRKSGTDWRTVTAYRGAMKTGTKFPPIAIGTVDGRENTIVDGWHRIKALTANREKEVEAEILPPMTEGEAIAEALKRNIAHGRPLQFQDKLQAYRKLRDHGYKIETITGILHIPRKQLRQFIRTRVTIGATGIEVSAKPAVLNVAEEITDEEQKSIGGESQFRLVTQLVLIIDKGWLDTKNKKLMEELAKLKSLLRGMSLSKAQRG